MASATASVTKPENDDISRDTILYLKSLRATFPLALLNNLHKALKNTNNNNPYTAFKPIQLFANFFKNECFKNECKIPEDKSDTFNTLITGILAHTFSIDEQIGIWGKQISHIMTAIAHIEANNSDEDITLLDGDFSNLGGTNLHFFQKLTYEKYSDNLDQYHKFIELEQLEANDKTSYHAALHELNEADKQDFLALKEEAFSLTDDVMKAICLQTAYILEQHEGQVVPIRNGGDEIRFLIKGIAPDDYEKIHNKIMVANFTLFNDLGLTKHPHLKEGRSGGMALGLSLLPLKNLAPKRYNNAMESGIETSKKTIARFMTDRDTNAVSKNLPCATIKTILKSTIDSLQENVQALKAYKTTKFQYNYSIEKRAHPFELPEDIRKRQLNQRFEEILTTGTPENNTLLETLSAFSTPRDPSSGAHLPGDEALVMQIFTQAALKLKNKFPNQNYQVHFVSLDIANLGGLNSILEHHGSDEVLAHINKIIGQKFAAQGIHGVHITHKGGAQYGIAVPPAKSDKNGNLDNTPQAVTQNDVADIMASIEIAIDQEINNQSITGYAEQAELGVETETIHTNIFSHMHPQYDIIKFKKEGYKVKVKQDFNIAHIISLKNKRDAGLQTSWRITSIDPDEFTATTQLEAFFSKLTSARFQDFIKKAYADNTPLNHKLENDSQPTTSPSPSLAQPV